MEVTKYNTEAIKSYFSDCSSLKQIVDRFDGQLRDSGQVICRVSVNGIKLSENDELQWAETSPEQISEIEFQTEKLDHLLRETLLSLKTYIADLKEQTVKSADIFRTGQDSLAQKEFDKIVDDTEYLLSALTVVKSHVLSSNAVPDLASRWQTIEIQMTKAARELIQAFESNDKVLLSDVLEFELYNSFDSWMGLIDVLISSDS